MMMQENQTASILPMGNQAKPGEPVFELNSQGERIERPAESVSSAAPTESIPEAVEEEFVELWDTPLAIPHDAFVSSTADDSSIVHEVIWCGHVLKSTHDLARWSEKTGARRVNSEESLDAICDISVTIEFNRANAPRAGNAKRNAKQQPQQRQQKSEIIKSWPVLKSTHDLATWSEKSGAHRVNTAEASKALEELAANTTGSTSKIISSGPVLKSTHDLATWSEKRGAHAVNGADAGKTLDDVAVNNQSRGNRGRGTARGTGQRRNGGNQNQGPSQIVKSWPVLKSTHDMAAWSEKRGTRAVNNTEAAAILDDVVKNQGAIQAGGSLQSGFDTQAGSHVQVEGSHMQVEGSRKSISETPEEAIQNLHLHV